MHLGLFTSLLSLFIHSDVSTTWTEDLTILFPATALEECSELFVEKNGKKKNEWCFFFHLSLLAFDCEFLSEEHVIYFYKKVMR